MQTIEQKRSAVKVMAWKLCLGGWRNDPVKMRLLPWAALYYSGVKSEEWLRREVGGVAQEVIDSRPDFVATEPLKMACAFVNGA